MATKTTFPIPQDKIQESFVWRDWFQKLSDRAFGTASTLDIPIEPEYGGTGLTTYNTGDIIYSNSTNNLTRLPAPASTSLLQMTAAGVPSWASPGVTSIIAGTAIGVSGATGAVTVNNTGVTSVIAGTGISVSGATGAVTISQSSATAKKYGAFSDYTDQTIASTTTAYTMTFNTTDLGSHGISVVSSSRLTVDTTGIYNFQWSGQFESSDNAPQDAFVWIRINGTNVVGSTGRIGLTARKSIGDPYHTIAGWNFLLSLTANDYVELVWSASSTSISIKTYAAGTSPTRPTTASLIATLQQL
jgi:hypothetical protein